MASECFLNEYGHSGLSLTAITETLLKLSFWLILRASELDRKWNNATSQTADLSLCCQI